MSKTDLDAKLARLSHFTNPPSDVVTDTLKAYAARVQELKSEQETRHELTKRHEAERRRLIQDLGFAATIRDRAYRAHWEGRKTVRVDALLEGRPEAEEAA